MRVTEDHEAVAGFVGARRRTPEGRGGRTLQERARAAVDGLAGEVVRGGVAQVDAKARIDFGQVDEVALVTGSKGGGHRRRVGFHRRRFSLSAHEHGQDANRLGAEVDGVMRRLHRFHQVVAFPQHAAADAVVLDLELAGDHVAEGRHGVPVPARRLPRRDRHDLRRHFRRAAGPGKRLARRRTPRCEERVDGWSGRALRCALDRTQRLGVFLRLAEVDRTRSARRCEETGQEGNGDETMLHADSSIVTA
jgi:hypothetical protein